MTDEVRTTRATAQVPAVPDDLESADVEKATGVVELPLHIRWSGPPRRYDLSDRQQRARAYEQVLREGNDADVRRFIRADELVELWDELVLPRHVRRAWAEWLERRRGVSVSANTPPEADSPGQRFVAEAVNPLVVGSGPARGARL